MRFRLHPKILLIAPLLGTLFAFSLPANAADPEPPPRVAARLLLQNNDFLRGTLENTQAAGTLRFQSPLFQSPFEFPADIIAKLEFPDNQPQPREDQEYSFELSGGDILFGRLVALGESELEIDSPDFGRIHLQTSRLRRIARGVLGPDGLRVPELAYLGPNGLDKWDLLDPELPAREENGAIVLDRPGSAVSSDVGLPLKAVIECELAWKAGTEFLFAFGVSKSDASVKKAFGIEVWEDDLVLARFPSSTRASLFPVPRVCFQRILPLVLMQIVTRSSPSAEERNSLSPQRMGVDPACPGRSVLQRIFSVFDHLVGGFLNSVRPLLVGPLHCGQFRLASSA